MVSLWRIENVYLNILYVQIQPITSFLYTKLLFQNNGKIKFQKNIMLLTFRAMFIENKADAMILWHKQ